MDDFVNEFYRYTEGDPLKGRPFEAKAWKHVWYKKFRAVMLHCQLRVRIKLFIIMNICDEASPGSRAWDLLFGMASTNCSTCYLD